MRIESHGLSIDSPPGWDARIFRRQPDGPAAAGHGRPSSHPVLHAANFALPEDRGDFGNGAVEIMGSSHVLVALVEYDAALSRTALYQRRGLPRGLRPEAFSPNQLHRTLAGQGGTQLFFSERDRAFCLYIVLGSLAARDKLVPQVNSALERTRIT